MYKMQKERRKYKRINKTMAVQIEDSYGILLDLSKGGMRIIPDVLPRKFENIRIGFITESGDLVELHGSIIRIVDRKEKDGKNELGLAFSKIPENYSKYIDALEKDESPSGIFQENVREDLVKAVLEGNEADLSLPQTGAAENLLEAPKEAPQPPAHEFPLEEIANIPLEEIMQEEQQEEMPESTPDETVAMPPPPPQEAAEEGIVNIPLEEIMQEDQQLELPGTPPPIPPESTPDETVRMPLDSVPLDAPQGDAAETPEPKKKKAAPRRIEISFEEFLQKNPQFIPKKAPPPIPKAPPSEDEQSLDRVFQGEQPASPPQISPEDRDDDQSLDGIFTNKTNSTSPQKNLEDREDDMSLDNIFKDRDES